MGASSFQPLLASALTEENGDSGVNDSIDECIDRGTVGIEVRGLGEQGSPQVLFQIFLFIPAETGAVRQLPRFEANDGSSITGQDGVRSDSVAHV